MLLALEHVKNHFNHSATQYPYHGKAHPSSSNAVSHMTGEWLMSRKSIHASEGEPSFFYLMMAEGCFRRAVSTQHPKAGGTLREIGRDYLARAVGVTSALESQPPQLRSTTTPWADWIHFWAAIDTTSQYAGEVSLSETHTRRAPQRIVHAHPPDQHPQVCVDLRPASQGAGFPTPVTAEAGTMPTHEGLGPDDRDSLQDRRKPSMQLDQKQAIAIRELDATSYLPPQHGQLMPKHGILCLKSA
jgi:hypothetical protein